VHFGAKSSARATKGKPSRRMSMLARSMIDGQYSVAGASSARPAANRGGVPAGSAGKPAQNAAQNALTRPGKASAGGGAEGTGGRQRRGSTGRALAEHLAATQARRKPAAAWSPAKTGAGGDKWRQAYAEANSQLSVMSGKERQAILRDAARERALHKQRLW